MTFPWAIYIYLSKSQSSRGVLKSRQDIILIRSETELEGLMVAAFARAEGAICSWLGLSWIAH